ncbi:MAG: hypothetical protein KME46_32805 [Brasilonema angustatum HA4187-MV1]|jgi:hypothetical protein|nr:hypothetical protein [Brasilonema angustatum HA4187-MV1]
MKGYGYKMTLIIPQILIKPGDGIYDPKVCRDITINQTNTTIALRPRTVSDFIRWFHKLPDAVLHECMEQFHISEIETDKLMLEMMAEYRYSFEGIEYWLIRKHEALTNIEIYQEYKHLECVADGILDSLQLILKIFDIKYSKYFDEIKSKIIFPEKIEFLGVEPMLWYTCEFFALKQTFLNNGMFGKAIRQGNFLIDEQIKQCSEQIKNYQETPKILPLNVSHIHKCNFNPSGYDLVHHMASELARFDIDFYNDVYKPYFRHRAQLLRKIKRNPNLHLFYLGETTRNKGKKTNVTKK